MDAIQYEPPSLDRSRLFRATVAALKTQEAKAAAPPPVVSDPEALKPISTRQIVQLINRYSLSAITYDKLKEIPLSALRPEEKEFVTFLVRNRNIFDRISSLDNDPKTLSVEDVKLAAQLAGDALTLSTEDLRYLREATSRPRETPSPSASLSTQTAQQTTSPHSGEHPAVQDLESLVRKLAAGRPDGLSYADLMAWNVASSRLTPQEQKNLSFLKSPPVSAMLLRLADDHNGQVTPEIIRILASLLWNPLLYGAVPIVFYKNVAARYHEEVEALEPAHEIERVEDEEIDIHTPKAQTPHLRLTAHTIAGICRRISPNGLITLAQLRAYVPQTPDERKALNLLRQSRIFDRLADLDHQPETLSEEDIRLAVAEKALVLSDPAMVLVILP